VVNGKGSGAGEGPTGGEFTEEDLQLGRSAVKFVRTLCVVGFVACVGISIFVFTNVPWDTRMPYDGKYNRSGSGIPMQIAVLPALVVLFGFWRAGRKSDAHRMGTGSRGGLYVLGTAIVFAAVVGQWVMANGILIAGGYFPGQCATVSSAKAPPLRGLPMCRVSRGGAAFTPPDHGSRRASGDPHRAHCRQLAATVGSTTFPSAGPA
jgi:hypothetical protein